MYIRKSWYRPVAATNILTLNRFQFLGIITREYLKQKKISYIIFWAYASRYSNMLYKPFSVFKTIFYFFFNLYTKNVVYLVTPILLFLSTLHFKFFLRNLTLIKPSKNPSIVYRSFHIPNKSNCTNILNKNIPPGYSNLHKDSESHPNDSPPISANYLPIPFLWLPKLVLFFQLC